MPGAGAGAGSGTGAGAGAGAGLSTASPTSSTSSAASDGAGGSSSRQARERVSREAAAAAALIQAAWRKRDKERLRINDLIRQAVTRCEKLAEHGAYTLFSVVHPVTSTSHCAQNLFSDNVIGFVKAAEEHVGYHRITLQIDEVQGAMSGSGAAAFGALSGERDISAIERLLEAAVELGVEPSVAETFREKAATSGDSAATTKTTLAEAMSNLLASYNVRQQ